MNKKFPINPAHPERVCWGCDLFCSAKDMRCGNGSDRTMHPVELFGEGWEDWGGPAQASPVGADVSADAVASPPPLPMSAWVDHGAKRAVHAVGHGGPGGAGDVQAHIQVLVRASFWFVQLGLFAWMLTRLLA